MGIGTDSPNNVWGAHLNWLWYYNKEGSDIPTLPDVNLTSSSNYIYMPRLDNTGVPLLNMNGLSASAQWNLHVNTLDLRFSRQISVDRLKIKPFAGVRADWIKQTLKLVYTSVFFANTAQFDPFIDVKESVHFTGYGLDGGIDANCSLCYGLSLFVNFSGGLLVSSSKLHHVEQIPGALRASIKNIYHSMTPIFDCGAGLSWDSSLIRNWFKVNLHAAWEQHFWLNVNRSYVFDNIRDTAAINLNNDSLGLNGLVVGGSLHF